jgi:Fe-S-cluster containining protein
MQIKVPCGFLDSSGRCSIYEDRPLVCVLYPFQYGAGDNNGNNLLAIDSGCPDSTRIALEIYMYRWYLRKQFTRSGTKIP